MITVHVSDSFPITNRLVQTGYPAGVVVVFEWHGDDELLPVVGEQVRLTAPGGQPLAATVGEIKCHGTEGRSFFFEGLGVDDAPLGTDVSWNERRVGPRRADASGRLLVVGATQPAA